MLYTVWNYGVFVVYWRHLMLSLWLYIHDNLLISIKVARDCNFNLTNGLWCMLAFHLIYWKVVLNYFWNYIILTSEEQRNKKTILITLDALTFQTYFTMSLRHQCKIFCLLGARYIKLVCISQWSGWSWLIGVMSDMLCLTSLLIIYITSEKQLCALQFSAHEALHVVVNVMMINMAK